MHQALTKNEFINALVREHVEVHKRRQTFNRDTDWGYLSIELTRKQDTQECCLIIRGNRVGTYWMIFDTGLPYTPEGISKAHHIASDLAMIAVKKIADKIEEPASIRLPEVSYFGPWFAEQVFK